MASQIFRHSATETKRRRRLCVRVGSLLILFAGLVLTASPTLASWTHVSALSLKGSCDSLQLSAPEGEEVIEVDELGTSIFPQDETLTAGYVTTTKFSCPDTLFPKDPNLVGSQIELSITNQTNKAFTELWYVTDPETTITNIDGLVNDQPAFRINRAPLVPDPLTMNFFDFNNPLIWESGAIRGVFEPGETWTFVIDNYKNSAGLPAHALSSIGVGSESGSPLGSSDYSSGSIIAVVPEPGTALLMGLGLSGLSLKERRKRRGNFVGRAQTPATHECGDWCNPASGSFGNYAESAFCHA